MRACVRACVRVCVCVLVGVMMRARRGSKWILIPESIHINDDLSCMHVHSLCFGPAQT